MDKGGKKPVQNSINVKIVRNRKHDKNRYGNITVCDKINVKNLSIGNGSKNFLGV